MGKLASIVEAYRTFAAPTSPVLGGLPSTVQIEPINVCNLKCPTCSVHRLDDAGVPRRYMRVDEFREIAEQLAPGTDIYLTNWGEPFLNPDIIEIIREGKRCGHFMRVDSNCNIDFDLIPEIIDSGVDIFKASIDGASQETYEKFRIKGDLEKSLEFVAKLSEAKLAAGREKPEIIWQYIVNRYNEHEISTARARAAAMPGEVRLDLVPMGLRQEKVGWDQYAADELAAMEEEWLPRDPAFRMDYFEHREGRPVIADKRCSFLWRGHMSISANFDVTPCCHTYLPKHAFGNVKETPIREIWNGPAFVASRRLSMGAISRDQCPSVCADCDNYAIRKDPGVLVRHWRFVAYMAKVAFSKLR